MYELPICKLMAVSNWQISKVGTSIENQEQGEEDRIKQRQNFKSSNDVKKNIQVADNDMTFHL